MAKELLSAKTVESAKSKQKSYTLNDGDGLSLEVPIKGKPRWRFRYRFNDKAKKISLGVFPDVSLLLARTRKEEARTKVADSIDPGVKDEVIQIIVTELTFTKWKDLFKEWQGIKESIIKCTDEDKTKKLHKRLDEQENLIFNRVTTFKQWTEFYKFKVYGTVTERHIERSQKGWDKYTFPAIGDTQMNKIMPRDVLKIMNLMNDKGIYESAKKVFSSIKRIFEVCFASFPDEIDINPCASIKLSDVLTEKQTVSYPKITDPKELGLLLNAILEYTGDTSTRLGLMFIAHTAVRPANVRFCKWEDINIKERLWTIPAANMKMNKEHKVPLTDQTIAILNEAAKHRGRREGIVFHSPKSKNSPMSDGTLVNGLRRMGYTREELVSHSFRGIFSTICHDRRTSKKHEYFNYDKDVIEMCLAHSVKSSVEGAYNEADYLEVRAELMQEYSDLLEEFQNGNK